MNFLWLAPGRNPFHSIQQATTRRPTRVSTHFVFRLQGSFSANPSKSYAFASLARPSWALGLPVLEASPDQPLACMAILLLVSQFKQTLTLQSLLCFCLCFSQSELPFPCHLSNPMATFVVDEPEMEGLVAADAAAVSQDEVAGAVAEPGRGGGLGGLGLAATSLAMAPLRSSGC